MRSGNLTMNSGFGAGLNVLHCFLSNFKRNFFTCFTRLFHFVTSFSLKFTVHGLRPKFLFIKKLLCCSMMFWADICLFTLNGHGFVKLGDSVKIEDLKENFK